MRNLFFAITAGLLLTPSFSSADIVSDIWGTTTDPLKLGSFGSDALSAMKEARAALLAIEALQNEVDADVRFYLEDFDKKIVEIERITNNTLENIDALLEKTIREINVIEKRLLRDVLAALKAAECTGNRLLDDAFGPDRLGKFPTIIVGNETIYQLPFGTQPKKFLGVITIGEEPATLVIDESVIRNPYEKYRIIEAGFLESLNNAPLDGEAILFPATYGFLAQEAAHAACLLDGTEFQRVFLTKKFAEYNTLTVPWARSVKIKY